MRVLQAFGAALVDVTAADLPGPASCSILGRDDFIRNKRATGRSKDLGDIEGL